MKKQIRRSTFVAPAPAIGRVSRLASALHRFNHLDRAARFWMDGQHIERQAARREAMSR